MSVHVAPLLRGRVVQSASTDNATATATVAAIAGTSHLILGVEAHFDKDVTAVKVITVTAGSQVYVLSHNFTLGLFAFAFPVAIHADVNEAVTATLTASGTSSTDGLVTLFIAEN